MSDEAVRDLMDLIEDAGAFIELEGENIRIVNGKGLSKSLIEQMREYKQAMFRWLTNDAMAREGGFLILLSGEAYEAQFSQTSSIFVQKVGDKWNAWRDTWQKGRSKSISHSTIIEQVSFDYALFKAKDRLDYVSQRRGGCDVNNGIGGFISW